MVESGQGAVLFHCLQMIASPRDMSVHTSYVCMSRTEFGTSHPGGGETRNF